MNALLAVSAALCVIGCAPALVATPEAVVSAIYDPLVKSNGNTKTDLKDIPMTENLRVAVWAAGFISDSEYCALQCNGDAVCMSRSRCESDAPRAELGNDVAGACADCSGFSGLQIAQTVDSALGLPNKVISATFNLSAGRTQSVYFHMQNGKDGWRVDNIVGPDRFNLRQIAFDTMQRAHDSRRVGTPPN